MPKWECSRCWRRYSFDEMNLLPHCWVNPKEHHKYGIASVCFCGAIFHKDIWHLSSFIDEYRVSTVHTNLGQHDNADIFDFKYDFYFETMIDKKKEWLGFQTRYKTMDDAIEGHFLAVDNLSNIILNPEKYPTSIIIAFCDAMASAKDQQETKFRIDNK